MPQKTKPPTPKPTPEVAPTQGARAARRAVVDILDEIYDTAAERYRGSASDQFVAKKAGVSVALVASTREQLFGSGEGCEADAETLKKLKSAQAAALDAAQAALDASAAAEAAAENVAVFLRQIESNK